MNPLSTLPDAAPMDAAEQSVPNAPRHPNNFGFIRHLLATAVVGHHAVAVVDGNINREPLYAVFHAFGTGTVAVFGFFVLSGFLITQSWARSPKFGGFLRNRILRIYPGFLLAALASIFIFGRLGANDPSYYQQLPLVQIAKGLVTLSIPGQLPAFGQLPGAGILNGSLWTIPIEFACYLIVGVAGVAGLLRIRWLWPTLLFLVLVVPEAFIMRFVPAALPGWMRMDVQLLYQVLPAFLAGMCFQLYRHLIPLNRFIAVGAAVLMVATLWDLNVARIGLSLGGAYLLFLFAFAPLPALRFADRGVDLSYGIYLYHWPCQLLILALARWVSPWQLFALSLPCAAALAFVSWQLVERPALNLKSSPRRVRAPAS